MEAVPEGVLWGSGRDLEQYREEMGRNDTARSGQTVDCEQFRNYSVGEGYQFRTVVRQPKTSIKSLTILDMSGGSGAVGQHVSIKGSKVVARRLAKKELQRQLLEEKAVTKEKARK
eukprot:CAMPEP_0175133422 /NCGR_PEP_ID=MMETSP0087-20121206/7634_1 /TAXON_ID=136419 /ORGANISM="Unknown Unknown, Strain D1" /LENGTH=115 /DNA_ID=CAMNT_0016415911 /DNA_START=39 /DNA_END=384 /DNA_ORIENTATION=-